jgi:hypothetical protein
VTIRVKNTRNNLIAWWRLIKALGKSLPTGNNIFKKGKYYDKIMINLSLEEGREKLIVDKCDLDSEVSQQSIIANHIGEKLVTVESLRDNAKENVSTVDAEVSSRLRKVAEEKNEKVTEAKLKELVISYEYLFGF